MIYLSYLTSRSPLRGILNPGRTIRPRPRSGWSVIPLPRSEPSFSSLVPNGNRPAIASAYVRCCRQMLVAAGSLVSGGPGFAGRFRCPLSGNWSDDAQAHAARCLVGSRPSVRSARVLRFCTRAARWNSSCAPESLLSRNRSKPWCTFKCAKRISTRFRSSRDLAKLLFSSFAVRRSGAI